MTHREKCKRTKTYTKENVKGQKHAEENVKGQKHTQ